MINTAISAAVTQPSSGKCDRYLDVANDRLLDSTLPLMARRWQRDRIVLGESFLPAMVAEIRRKGMTAIDLRHAVTPELALAATGCVTLAYDPSDPQAARPALLAAAGQDGWPIAGDPHSLALLTLAERVSASDIPVLLEGPTGAGKEVLARFVHRLSPRSEGPFVAINCAAMPEAMLESLLFGHRKGAFTGATEASEGIFRAAHRGTLILDEVGELPLALQAKLLRALQEGEVLPLGATRPDRVDVRVIACTNRNLVTEVSAGRFREDLLYRLKVFPLNVPALCDRVGDIVPLAFGMLLRHAARSGRPSWIKAQAQAMLEMHTWPGNVRELENVIRRAILLSDDAQAIGPEHIVFDHAVRAVVDSAPSINAPVESIRKLADIAFVSESKAILAALSDHDGNRSATARTLGISERTLRYRLASMRANGLMVAEAGGRP